MKPALKYGIRGVIFALGLIVLLLAASKIMMPKDNASESGMMDSSANGILAEQKNSIDVLILGDSETYSSMIPLQMWQENGITAYCCGTPAQRLYYSQEFLHKTFENQSPKVVILETNCIFRNFSVSDSVVHRASQLFPIFTYHNRWKSMNLGDLQMAVRNTTINNTKGYQFNTGVKAADTTGYMAKSDEAAPITSQNRSIVESIATYCKEKGARLILVSTPSTVNWNSARHNSIQQLAKDLGVDYIDMNTKKNQDQIAIDWKLDTRDGGDHMNFFGAEKVTSYLSNYIAATGLVSDNKSNRTVEHWDKASESFNDSIADQFQD